MNLMDLDRILVTMITLIRIKRDSGKYHPSPLSININEIFILLRSRIRRYVFKYKYCDLYEIYLETY